MKTVEYHSQVGVEFLEDFGISIYEFIELTTADPSWHFSKEIQALLLSGFAGEHSVSMSDTGDFWLLITKFQLPDLDYTWFALQYSSGTIH